MHIQDPNTAKLLIPHWGYSDRVVPCINGPGICAYLDAVYDSHDLSMIYTFILWGIIGAISIIWVVIRVCKRFKKKPLPYITELEGQKNQTVSIPYSRVIRTTLVYLRRRLLPKFPGSFFGQISRVQVLILALLSSYLLLCSLVGIVYKSWVTPNMMNPNVFDTRSGFAGYADRVGVFAFALTPLTIFLSTRESILTLITGISYQHFNFLHRWTGRLIFIFGFLHTYGWMVLKGCMYQPQPKTFISFIIQPFIIWGCVAMITLLLLYVFSIRRVIQWTGYEFFLISHLILAVMFIASCWKHWDLLECWMISSLVIMLLDFVLRKISMMLVHFKLTRGSRGFSPARSVLSVFDDANGKVVRLDFDHEHRPWKPGQHYFLTFPALSIWQSHPFTTLSLPKSKKSTQHHSYIIRCRKGETAKLSALATTNQITPVLLSGPYGRGHLHSRRSRNILAITGGTGISFALPCLMEAALHPEKGCLQLVWIIRRVQNLNWAGPELMALRDQNKVHIRILITSGIEVDSDEEKDLLGNKMIAQLDEGKDMFKLSYLNRRPKMGDVITDFLHLAEEERVLVLGSGPPCMGMDVRAAVAKLNSPLQVWKGNRKKDIEFYWDY